MPVTDEDAAITAISSLDPLSPAQTAAKDKIKTIIASTDPFINIHELLAQYNILYFRSLLLPRVEATWSSRLTLCAGICELVKDDEGKYRRIRLKLSEPLLKYRTRSDVINTLLHEAIHSYFFITTSWRHSRGADGTGHGGGFLLLADAINNHGAYEVTVYHTFHDEVDSYRTHVWQCDGPCSTRAPFFGLVKRSSNRPPSKNDTWWKRHEEECGGSWIKTAEPEMTNLQISRLGALQRAGLQKNKIDSWVVGSKTEPSRAATREEVVERNTVEKKRPSEGESSKSKRVAVTCPICLATMPEVRINAHLDTEH